MSSAPPLRVVLGDHHHFSREGLRATLEADGAVVVGEASDDAHTCALIASLQPDVVVIDPEMSGGAVGETLQRIAATDPTVPVAVLTASADGRDLLEALTGGADSYLLKDTPADQLVGAIRQTAAGNAVLSASAAHTLVAHVVIPSSDAEDQPTLSGREREVLRLMVEGADNAAIGKALSISRHTVKQHVTNIFSTLGVNTRVQAAVRAVRDGLV